MRFWELIETTAEKAAKLSRANDQLRAADREQSDAFRRCQEKRAKAAETGDVSKASDASRAFYKSRATADTKSANARAKLRKLQT